MGDEFMQAKNQSFKHQSDKAHAEEFGSVSVFDRNPEAAVRLVRFRCPEAYALKDGVAPDVAELLQKDIEEALSYLLLSKPWVREAEQLRHRALFLELSQVVARDVAAAVLAVGESSFSAANAVLPMVA
jgi:hypothetical protein